MFDDKMRDRELRDRRLLSDVRRAIDDEEKDIQLVKLILDIAKNLNVPVVAEGVETKSQLELLRKLGCRLVQGYYFSRPLPAADFERDILCADKK